MNIKEAKFVKSASFPEECPASDRPEYAFIGRSNVGKSSLINALTERKKLAKTSSTPGKTQLINHFDINGHWYLVDLPGYGYAKVSKKDRAEFGGMIRSYILNRKNLVNLFVLVDSRHDLQKLDREFMRFLGEKGIPFSIVFTKTDKLSSSGLNKSQVKFKKQMLEDWESLPPSFLTSAEDKRGCKEILDYIDGLNKSIDPSAFE